MIIDQMMGFAGDVLTNNVSLKKFDVKKHLLREVLNTTGAEPFVPSATMIEFKNIATVKSLKDGSTIGFVCTCRGTKIVEGAEALNLGFV